jgi:dipeptidyl aminopeptidase/acylaminoacyl peptidase
VADRPEYHYFDPNMQALQRGLEQAFPDVSVSAVSWDTALKTVIVAVDAPKQPPTYYYLNRETHQATKIGNAYPDLSANDLGEMKPYPYKARDGVDIPAYLTLPPGKPAKKLPAIVMPHGGPDARDDLSFDWMVQFFANRGYAVLQPNYRGSAGYGHKFTEAGLHQWGLKMQDDITDGVKKTIADGIVDPKRVCIVGASYGGYAALAGAALTPDLYACAISFAGVSDLPTMIASERGRYGKTSGALSFWISRIGSPDDDSAQLRATSPARHADRVKCPVLLLHGEGDITVPIKQSELMADALKSAGKQVEFIRFPGEDHYFSLADTRIRFLKESEAFLAKNIGN